MTESSASWKVVALTIVSRHNTPVFFRTYADPEEGMTDPTQQPTAAGSTPQTPGLTLQDDIRWNLRTDGENVVRYHYAIYASLDVLEERIAAYTRQVVAGSGSTPQQQGAHTYEMRYMGKLLALEDCHTYGYCGASRVKIVLALVGEVKRDDTDVKRYLHALYDLWLNAACDPFYTPDTEISSAKFTAAVDRLLLGKIMAAGSR